MPLSLRAAALGRHQARLRWAIDIGIDQANFAPQPRHRHRQIGGQRGFANAAFARANRDDRARARRTGGALFGGRIFFSSKSNAHIASTRFARGIADCHLELVAREPVEPTDFEH